LFFLQDENPLIEMNSLTRLKMNPKK